MKQNHNASSSIAMISSTASSAAAARSRAAWRNVDHILTRTLLPEISQEILARMAEGQALTKVHITLDGNGAFRYAIT